MSCLADFTRAECDYFRQECNFTPDELAIFDLRSRGASVVEVAMALSMSLSTVTRKTNKIKAKIWKVL